MSSAYWFHKGQDKLTRNSFKILKFAFRGLSRFGPIYDMLFRNSYGYRKCHIYEAVKLNQIKLSNQLNYSESEKRFKAFIEHDLD